MTTEPNSAALRGLVLAGGKSVRMGRDKAALVYADRPQWQACAELLGEYCGHVSISPGPNDGEYTSYDVIPDRGGVAGPMAGLLGAFDAEPGAAWLVLACDLPFIDRATLAALVEGRDTERRGTAFMAGDGFFEPLCAIYEPAMRVMLEEAVVRDDLSLRHALSDSNVRLLCPPDAEKLWNVNTPEEFASAVRALESGRRA